MFIKLLCRPDLAVAVSFIGLNIAGTAAAFAAAIKMPKESFLWLSSYGAATVDSPR